MVLEIQQQLRASAQRAKNDSPQNAANAVYMKPGDDMLNQKAYADPSPAASNTSHNTGGSARKGQGETGRTQKPAKGQGKKGHDNQSFNSNANVGQRGPQSQKGPDWQADPSGAQVQHMQAYYNAMSNMGYPMPNMPTSNMPGGGQWASQGGSQGVSSQSSSSQGQPPYNPQTAQMMYVFPASTGAGPAGPYQMAQPWYGPQMPGSQFESGSQAQGQYQ